MQKILFLKRKAIEEKLMKELRKRWRKISALQIQYRFNHLQRQYEDLIYETDRFDKQIKKILSVFLYGFVVIITYITYLLLEKNPSPNYRITLIVVYLTHWFTLIVLIYSSSQIYTTMHEIARLNRSHLANILDNRSIDSRLKIKSFLMLNSLEPIGFNLTNGFCVTKSFYFIAFQSISSFYFLISKSL
ncbi:glutamate transporter [Sarcoptes scabiei]|nr:glutamate transporter [Sarcoptes scabiei]